MTLISRIKNYWAQLMASQLRLPSGVLAKLTGTSMNKANFQLYQLTLENLQLQDGDRVLEIGFGNGEFFPMLNSLAKNLRIAGLDHSQEMVSEAKKRNKDLYKTGLLELAVGSSDSMSFSNESFDKVFCINVIYFWENPQAHLAEIYRVLKPGGIFCIGFRPKENLEKFSFSQFGFKLFSAQDCENLLTENGFLFAGLRDESHLNQNSTPHKSKFESLCAVAIKPQLI